MKNRKLKIACFSHYFTPEIGAPSARFYDMSRHWLAQGHSVDVVTCFPNHPKGEVYAGYRLQGYMYERLDGINIHRNWTYITANTGVVKRILGHFTYWPSVYIHSEKHLSGLDVTIGTSPTFFAAMAALGIAKRRHIPFIMDVRDLWPAVFVDLGVIRNNMLIKLLEKWELYLYRQATKIVTVTASFRKNLIDRGVPAKKIHTIPNGANIEFWQSRKGQSDLRYKLNLQNKFVVLYIGAHGISHALDKILDSALLLRGKKDIHFLFVGDGAKKSELKNKSKELSLQNVSFHDAVPKEKVIDFYKLADVCLVPLRNIPLFDTFIPSKIFEIMAVGRPIVASVGGEAAEILEQSGGAIVVAPEDTKAIANALCELKDSPNRRKSMGEKGRFFVERKYSRKILADKYIDVIKEAIQYLMPR